MDVSPYVAGLVFGASIATLVACALAWGIMYLLQRFGGPWAVRIGGGLLSLAVIFILVGALGLFLSSAPDAGDLPAVPEFRLQMALNVGTCLLVLAVLLTMMRRHWNRRPPPRDDT
ncbi:hypothetical protein [Jannaschia marina]|uniref:hypothetical protein n=1 Tax=Jannaschia marina TaxID=2741674 RepID=UPI0015C85240|nr:hypothetical protein [Jannaschia marina]